MTVTAVFALLNHFAPFWLTVFTVVGLCVGSFLNVVIFRLPEREEYLTRLSARDFLGTPPTPAELAATPPGIALQPSHCMHCQHPLAPWQNIPVLSWLLLRGRCFYCHAPVSCQYPLVELLTGSLTLVTLLVLGFSWLSLSALLALWCLIALSVIDIQRQLLPDSLVLPLLWLGLLLSTFPLFVSPSAALWGAALGFGSLWLVNSGFHLVRHRDGLGGGDLKLFAVAGAWLGWQALPFVLLVAVILGLFYGLGLHFWRHRPRHPKVACSSPYPFGPSLALAFWLVLLARYSSLGWFGI